MALLGQQTPKIKTNLNEKKREKFGKQEELKKKKKRKIWKKKKKKKKKKLVEGPSSLERKFNTAFPEYHIGKKYSSKHISYSGK